MIEREKVRTIVYDIVLVATVEEGMKRMLRRFRKYVERKGLTVNTEKSKVLVFERGRGRGRRRREWSWGEEKLEKVKEMKYLGYIVEKNGKAEKHIKERIRKAAVAMKRMWHIGERLFKENFGRRIKMFVAIVESIAMYGAEIWAWNDEGQLDIEHFLKLVGKINSIVARYGRVSTVLLHRPIGRSIYWK